MWKIREAFMPVSNLIRRFAPLLGLLLALVPAAPALADYSAMDGTYVNENGSSVSLEYMGEGTVDVTVKDAAISFRADGGVLNDHTVAVYNAQGKRLLLLFLEGDHMLAVPGQDTAFDKLSSLMGNYSREGAGEDPWLEPTATYANDAGSLVLEYEGEGSVKVTMQSAECSFEAYSYTVANHGLIVYRNALPSLAVYFGDKYAVAIPLNEVLCPLSMDSVFPVSAEATEQARQEAEEAKPGGVYSNASGTVTLAYDGEGQGMATIKTTNCSFEGLCFFFPAHMASITYPGTQDTVATFFYEKDYAIVKPVNMPVCRNAPEFDEKFYASEAASAGDQFLEPGGTFQSESGRTIKLHYYGEGVVDVEIISPDCQFKGDGMTFIDKGIAIYGKDTALDALIFYERGYVSLKFEDQGFCGGAFEAQDIYYRMP